MNLISTLQNIGLSEKQAKVYLAALELGPASILEIAQTSGIKRPTCYVLLEELARRNLVSPANKQKSRYTAADPSTLLFHVEQQRQNLQAALPNLQAKNFHTQGRPTTQVYAGRQGWDHLAKLHIRNSPMLSFYANTSHNGEIQDNIIQTMLITGRPQSSHTLRAIFAGKTPSAGIISIPGLRWKATPVENNDPAMMLITNNAVIYPTIADSWDTSSWLVLQSARLQNVQISMFEALWAATPESSQPQPNDRPQTPNRSKPATKGPSGLTKLPGFMRK